jgi:hypothetical protein
MQNQVVLKIYCPEVVKKRNFACVYIGLWEILANVRMWPMALFIGPWPSLFPHGENQ